MGRGRWFNDGYGEGAYAAEVNLGMASERAELVAALADDTLGEIAGQIREHQVQMAGDISYDVDRDGGPTDEQYSRWEEGFYEGFRKTVESALRPKKVAKRAVRRRMGRM